MLPCPSHPRGASDDFSARSFHRSASRPAQTARRRRRRSGARRTGRRLAAEDDEDGGSEQVGVDGPFDRRGAKAKALRHGGQRRHDRRNKDRGRFRTSSQSVRRREPRLNGAAAFGGAQAVAIEAFQGGAHFGRQRDAFNGADSGEAVTAEHKADRASERRTVGP
jgi:hypothetical protein